MKIALCHESTPQEFTDLFIAKWDMYKLIDLPVFLNKSDSSEMNKEDFVQNIMDDERKVTNIISEAMIQNFSERHVLYNNTMLNVLSDCIIWVENNYIKNDDFITTQFHLSRETMKFLDCIFLLKDVTAPANAWVKATRRNFDDFKRLFDDGDDYLFPTGDMPMIIEIPFNPKNPKQAIESISEFLQKDGGFFEPEGLDINSELNEMKNMISEEDIRKIFEQSK